MTDLFVRETFVSHSGLNLDWKTDCDALSDGDLDTLAWFFARGLPYGRVYGIPRGGLRFARALEGHAKRKGPFLLIVDDVLTTGRSMAEAKAKFVDEGVDKESIRGAVIFSRTPEIPPWITAIWTLSLPVPTVTK